MDPSHLVIHGPFWVVFLSRKKSRIISIIIISSYSFHSGCWNLPIQHFHHPSGRFQPVRFGAHSWPRTNRRVLLGAVLAKTTEPPGRGPKRRLEMCVLVGGPVEDPEESRWRSRDGSKAFKTTIFGFIWGNIEHLEIPRDGSKPIIIYRCCWFIASYYHVWGNNHPWKRKPTILSHNHLWSGLVVSWCYTESSNFQWVIISWYFMFFDGGLWW